MENRYNIYTNIFFKKTNSQKVISNVSQAVECGLSRLTCIGERIVVAASQGEETHIYLQ